MQSAAMESEWIICMQCDTEFEYTAAEQDRHVEKGYDAPQRCPACRKHKTKFITVWEPWESKGRNKNYRKKRKGGDGRTI